MAGKKTNREDEDLKENRDEPRHKILKLANIILKRSDIRQAPHPHSAMLQFWDKGAEKICPQVFVLCCRSGD